LKGYFNYEAAVHIKRRQSLIIFLGVLLLGLCCKGLCQSDNEDNNTSCIGRVIEGKYYIYPGTVYIAPNGIFLNIDNDLVAISSVFSDKNGVYVTMEELKSVGRTWICDVCYFDNPSYLQYCDRCGSPRPKPKSK